ncbi:MAG: helix-hairpin-helix domain-containing protein [Halanaerobiales bacterium]
MRKVDINRADVEELMGIRGVGGSTAERIVSCRRENGPFHSPEDISLVKGIGEKKLEKICPEIKVEDVVEIEFDPDRYGIGKPEEVHLVGDMNDWDPADYSYSLDREEDGLWRGIFLLGKGTEFKFLYDSNSWDEGNDIGGKYGDNLVIK